MSLCLFSPSGVIIPTMVRKLVYLAVLMVVGLMAYAPSRQASAASLPCSSSGSLVTIILLNHSGVPIDLFWIDYMCDQVQYVDDLPNGSGVGLLTAVTHPWIIYNANTGTVLYCFVATVDATITIIDVPQNYCGSSAPVNGAAPSAPVPPDDRINFLHCDHAFVVYQRTNDANEVMLEVYGIEGDKGTLLFTVDGADVATLGDGTPSENTLIKSVGDVRAYLLTTGEVQINGAHDAENKECVVIFDGIAPKMNDSYTVE